MCSLPPRFASRALLILQSRLTHRRFPTWPRRRERSFPMRILIAEDHPDNREMLTRRLERKGYEVHCAENGAEAVDMAKSCSPDLILMDISMPVMSGIEATRVLRQTPEVSNVKIVALTAHAME